MAIPRMFNSNTPFVIVTGGSELSFLGKEEDGRGCEEEEEEDSLLVQAIAPHLSRVLQRGTAKYVVTEEDEEDPCVSIVAQAEREDFQEFSPSSTRTPFSRSQLLHKHRFLLKDASVPSDTEDEDFDEAAKLPFFHLQRKQRRKTRSRPSREEGEERPIIRGLWVQEIDWLKSSDRDAASAADIIPPPPQFTDVCDGVGRSEEASPSDDRRTSTDTEDGGGSDCPSVFTHESESDSSLCVEADRQEAHRRGVEAGASDSTFDLMHVSGFNSSPLAEWESDSAGRVRSPLGLSDSFEFDESSDEVFDELSGKVTQIPKTCVSAVFRDLMKRILNDWKITKPANEGLLFHHRLQPSGSRYREGEEYRVLHHIQNGSYGDVFCVRDKSTGFKCAAKRIPLSHFSSEEVSTWSALNSPRVVELFGAVREGLNIVLFMDLKPACLAQLLKEMSCLPEDLALHYLHQSLGALEHLHHRKVLHLDVKVDNVLLSADCRDAFLCDFGLSETLDDSGRSAEAFRGAALPGTETHMAPEVARGDRLCAKADVWSSCCMLLHMLNGWQPWIRYYSHPLCLQIVKEPPPLWEVPSNCNNFTAKVFRAGLQKDSDRRASAKELRRKTTQALRAVGGLSPRSVQTACEKLCPGRVQDEDVPSSSSPETPNEPTMHWVSPWRTTAMDEDDRAGADSDRGFEVETESSTRKRDSEPKSLRDDYVTDEKDWESDSEVDIYMGEDEYIREKWLKTDRDYEGDWEEEEEEREGGRVGLLRVLRVPSCSQRSFPVAAKRPTGRRAFVGIRGRAGVPARRDGKPSVSFVSSRNSSCVFVFSLPDVVLGATVRTPSPEPRDDPPSCFSCSDASQLDASEKDSDHSSDDLSSGVFSSCNSETDGRLEWSASANQTSSRCFEGVDIWIENVQGECLRIRERRRVKVGHVAIGISDQVSGKAFTLETLDRKTVSFEQEIRESGLWLRCVPAPDRCQRWRWRVRDGKLELRE
ncbi:mitogen-activated protein kinase kinase kinase 14 [Brachyistius frenatus]|uniref:mitogen-activated protein kinase kinase kinase 14 n=1 Tax=Brachyistius frenatus TaxID=100188 RepID=UPI0037E97495